MIETHPFGNFIPPKMKYLLLGSFGAKGADTNPETGWYYGSKFNQLWKILEKVYSVELQDKKSKVNLFTHLRMGVSDIIHQCERREGRSSDTNLINIVYNHSISDILEEQNIEKIFFTSRFVEKNFQKIFIHLVERYPEVELITLPSPSPRYAQMSLDEKVEKYKGHMPVLSSSSRSS